MSPAEAASTTGELMGSSNFLFLVLMVSTIDYDCTPELLAANTNGEQQTSVPNQDATVKIRYITHVISGRRSRVNSPSASMSWRGRLHHKSSRRFAAVKNALLHRRPPPDVPEIQEQRKVSDKTVDSENTVCRRPSLREDSPIAMQRRSQPDDDILQRTTTEKIKIPKSRPIPEYSFRDFSGITQGSGCSEYTPPALCSLPSYMLHQRLFSNMGMQNRQARAFDDFNHLAEFHNFYTLIPPEHDPISK